MTTRILTALLVLLQGALGIAQQPDQVAPRLKVDDIKQLRLPQPEGCRHSADGTRSVPATFVGRITLARLILSRNEGGACAVFRTYFANKLGNHKLKSGTNVISSNVISRGIRKGTVPRITC